jgi:DNA-binding transcriptional ArsR family regulator
VKERKVSPALMVASLLIALTVAILLLPGLNHRGRSSSAGYLPAPSTAVAAEVNSWTQAVQKIKENRGEPTGKQAKVETPQQLRHYSDTRRFLAVQVAEWREHHFATPKDFVELAAMIKSGELVELKQVSENYILFGVGGSADLEPFTRYENGKGITLYKEAELAEQYAQMAKSHVILENEIISLRGELGSLNKRERSRRAALQAQINEKEKALKVKREGKELLDRYYGDDERRQQLFMDYESLASLAKSFSDRTYDIADARSRRDMKVRMLSSLRPEALKVLEEVAASYRQKFDRPLPITSLVRPDEYQHALGKVNPNATQIETPPHSTGLAFDVYYRFMTAEEQSFVMAHLARLKDEGRIEVLRELRDHYHVFAFVDGKRPDEAVIRATLNKTTTAKATKEAQLSE